QRYLRKYIPDKDFAYTVWDSGSNGYNSRHRGLAFNRKARDILVENGVLKEREYEPVLILDRAPRGIEDLDRRYGKPVPAFTPEQMARLREHEAVVWAEHLSNPKPPRAPDLARSLSLLRARKKANTKDFDRPASPKALAQAARDLGIDLPEA